MLQASPTAGLATATLLLRCVGVRVDVYKCVCVHVCVCVCVCVQLAHY